MKNSLKVFLNKHYPLFAICTISVTLFSVFQNCGKIPSQKVNSTKIQGVVDSLVTHTATLTLTPSGSGGVDYAFTSASGNAPFYFTVRNTSEWPAYLEDVVSVWNTADGFSISSDNCSQMTLNGGSTCQFSVDYEAQSAGTKFGRVVLNFRNSAGDEQDGLEALISGPGVAYVPTPTYTPSPTTTPSSSASASPLPSPTTTSTSSPSPSPSTAPVRQCNVAFTSRSYTKSTYQPIDDLSVSCPAGVLASEIQRSGTGSGYVVAVNNTTTGGVDFRIRGYYKGTTTSNLTATIAPVNPTQLVFKLGTTAVSLVNISLNFSSGRSVSDTAATFFTDLKCNATQYWKVECPSGSIPTQDATYALPWCKVTPSSVTDGSLTWTGAKRYSTVGISSACTDTQRSQISGGIGFLGKVSGTACPSNPYTTDVFCQSSGGMLVTNTDTHYCIVSQVPSWDSYTAASGAGVGVIANSSSCQ